MPFFEFNQNNSGGWFEFDKDRGIGHYVIVEAENLDEATEKAERIGLYFDGSGDCSCCGNRWYEPWEEGTETPMHYGKEIETYKDQWGRVSPETDGIFVHYKNGVVEFYSPITYAEREHGYKKVVNED